MVFCNKERGHQMFSHLKKHWARWTLTTLALVGLLPGFSGDNRCRWRGYLTDMNSSMLRR